MWQRRKRRLSESAEIVESAKTSVPFFLEHGGTFSIKGNLNKCDGSFLLNEHGDLYFLLHKNIVHIIFVNLEKKNKIICLKEKKI